MSVPSCYCPNAAPNIKSHSRSSFDLVMTARWKAYVIFGRHESCHETSILLVSVSRRRRRLNTFSATCSCRHISRGDRANIGCPRVRKHFNSFPRSVPIHRGRRAGGGWCRFVEAKVLPHKGGLNAVRRVDI